MDISFTKHEKRFNKNENKVLKMFFIILVIITVLQQMPIVKDLVYTEIRYLLYIGFGLISIYSFFTAKNIINYRFQILFILTIIYSVILIMITLFFTDKQFNVLELIIPFGVFVTSLRITFTKRQIDKLLILYIFLTIILGITSIYYYGEGLKITENYFLEFKNQIGPLLGIAATMLIIWIFKKQQFTIRLHFIYKICMLILLITTILIIRNRAGLLGISLIIFILIIQMKVKFNYRNIFITLITLIIIIITLFYNEENYVINIIKASFISNYEVNNLDSLSAGRMNVYKDSIKYIIDNPLLGELVTESNLKSTPHNYIINKLVNYGIIGGFLFVLFYLYLWFFVIINLIKARKNNYIFTLPLWVLVFSLIVSLFEYTYPFGPGVTQVMLWFLLGQYFKEENENKAIIK